MNFAFAKKAVNLNGGIFNGVGSMTNVLHAGGAHVSSNCTGWSLSRIGRSEQVTNGRHGVFAFHYESELTVENGISQATSAALAELGHPVETAAVPLGGGQAIHIDWQRGTLTGGSDPRKDGCALGY